LLWLQNLDFAGSASAAEAPSLYCAFVSAVSGDGTGVVCSVLGVGKGASSGMKNTHGNVSILTDAGAGLAGDITTGGTGEESEL